jgi:hypothetical protein
MTIVRPCRLITRQRSHIGFTDGRTFILELVPFVQAGCARRQKPRAAGR